MEQYWQRFLHELEPPFPDPVPVFSLILLIILLAPAILKRFNIPGIIGLILSGVAIGPHGLHFLEKNAAIDLFATIGLLYIMFIAGLELDLREFRLNRNKSMVFGFFTFSLPLLIGYPVCKFVLALPDNAALLTAGMFATHTLVAYPVVSRMSMTKNEAVAITVGGTILTDTAVLLMLAVITSSAEGSLNAAYWISFLLSLAAFGGLLFWGVPRISKWFFSVLESEQHSHYIFVLAVVFLSAFLAELAGVGPIIGAFLAGLALNKLIPHTSALMNRIEFIGNALFIPFFLISVGMLVDLSVLFRDPAAWITAAVLSTVALLSKWLAAWTTQQLFGYSTVQRSLIFGLSSSHAAATLAVILVGYKSGILGDSVLNGTIILILITCIVATIATERATKTLLIQGENEDAPGYHLHSGEHLLLPIANFENIEKLLETAILLREPKSDHPISLLTVVSNDDEAEVNIRKAKRKLENYVKQGTAAGTPVDIIAAIDHNPFSGIARISREIMADLILLGWPQRTGLLQRFLGDKVDGLLNTTQKTIFICHLEKPVHQHRSITLLIPAFAEHERGFEGWWIKIIRLSRHLNVPVKVHATAPTLSALQAHKTAAGTQYVPWESEADPMPEIAADGLAVLIGAREGFPSYNNHLDDLPGKAEAQLGHFSRIIIYPH